MKKYILITLLIGMGLFVNSCSKDNLDIPQRGVINTQDYYTNATDAEARSLIAYIYKQVYETTNHNWIQMWGGLAKNVETTGGIYSNVNVSSQNHNGNDLYFDLYRINHLCNMIIENLEENSNEKTIIKGEAYFWRAWVNTYLIQAWGTPPLVDHVLGQDELDLPNGDPSQLWDFVEASLQEAITRLPEKSGINGQADIGGRVTVHSAYALMGKSQLWSGRYTASISSLEQVISSNLYDLEPDYSLLYRPMTDYSMEYVWEFNIEDSDVANYNLENDRRTLSMGWRTENVEMPGGVFNGFGIASNYTKDFYDFIEGRGEKGLNRYMGTVWAFEEALDKFIELEGAVNRAESIDMFWKDSPVLGNSQGYLRSKMYPYEEDIFPNNADQDLFTKANWPGMRYSEVLLNYAEACMLSNSKLAEGLAALNEVRSRAGLDPLPSLTLQAVKDEKRAELVLEGNRFLDLIRWGDAPTELNDRGLENHSFLGYVDGTDVENGTPADYNIQVEPVQGSEGFITGRDELFPFPYTELLLNENLVQNPGW